MKEETGTDNLLKMLTSNISYQVLTKNYFNFNDQLYEQKQGTAMGTRMAPNYAIIFMHYLETNFLSTFPTLPSIWLRFTDDIFMIWNYGEQQSHICITSNSSLKFYCLLFLLNLYSFLLILYIYTLFIHWIFTGDIYFG